MKKLFKTVFFVTVISVATRVISFLFRIYISRTIGAEQLGIYQIALSLFFLLATLTAGIPLIVSRSTAEFRTVGNIKAEKGLLSAALILGFSISVVVTGATYALSPLLPSVVSDPRCVPLLLILMPSALSSVFYGIGRAWFWGKKNYYLYCITEFFECIIRVALGILFINVIFGKSDGATGTAASFTVSDYICSAIIVCLFFVKGGKLSKPSPLKPLITTSSPITFVRLYSSLITSLTAIILPARLIAGGMEVSSAMAEYGRAMGMAIPLLFAPATLTGALAVVLVPETASDKACGNFSSLRSKIEHSLVTAVLAAGIFLVVFLPLGSEIGLILFADEKAGKMVSYAAVMMIPLNINQITATMLNSLGMEKKTLINYVIGSVFLLLCLFFLPKYAGVYALFIGMGTCFTVISVLNLITLNGRIGFAPKFLTTILFTAIAAATSTYGASIIKSVTGGLPVLLHTVIAASFAVGFFALSAALMGYAKYLKS